MSYRLLASSWPLMPSLRPAKGHRIRTSSTHAAPGLSYHCPGHLQAGPHLPAKISACQRRVLPRQHRVIKHQRRVLPRQHTVIKHQRRVVPSQRRVLAHQHSMLLSIPKAPLPPIVNRPSSAVQPLPPRSTLRTTSHIRRRPRHSASIGNINSSRARAHRVWHAGWCA